MMSKSFKLIFICLLIFLSAVPSLASKDGQFTIISLNDTHSHLYPYKNPVNQKIYGGAARWKTIIDNIRKETDEVLVLHGGDALTGSDLNYLIDNKPDWNRLPGYGYRGLLDFSIFNMIGIDAMTMGNHEFDYGIHWLFKLLPQAGFSLLSANIEAAPIVDSSEFELVRIIKPYVLFERGGLSIAVIGLTTVDYFKTIQIRPTNPVQAAREIIDQVKSKADIIIVLSHLGYEEDVKLAQAVKGIDIIIGGHSHTVLHEKVCVGDTTITQTGDYGRYLGRLDVTVKNSKITDLKYQLIPIDFSVPEDSEVARYLDDALHLGIAEGSYVSDNSKRSSIADLILQTMLEDSGADMAIYTSRLVNGALPAGKITPETFFTVFWPYRPRELAPDKDMTPKQMLDIVRKKTHRLLRPLLYISDGISNIVNMEISSSVIPRLIEFNESLSGSPQYLQMLITDEAMTKSRLNVVMDMQTCRFLYEMGFIDESVLPNVRNYELFELMLRKFANTKSIE